MLKALRHAYQLPALINEKIVRFVVDVDVEEYIPYGRGLAVLIDQHAQQKHIASLMEIVSDAAAHEKGYSKGVPKIAGS